MDFKVFTDFVEKKLYRVHDISVKREVFLHEVTHTIE